jgi:hypothetical protein
MLMKRPTLTEDTVKIKATGDHSTMRSTEHCPSNFFQPIGRVIQMDCVIRLRHDRLLFSNTSNPYQLNIKLSRLSNRLNPRRARPTLSQSFQSPQLTLNSLLSSKVPLSTRQLLKRHRRVVSRICWANPPRKRKAQSIVYAHRHRKTNHPPSLVEILSARRDPRRMVGANQARHSQDCSRYPGEQSFEIPAFGSVVEAAWRWIEERRRVDVAFFDEEVVDDDDLIAADG